MTFGEPRRSAVYAQNTTDVTIHLMPEASAAFHVVDAITGAPIERFGFEIGKAPSRHSSSSRAELPLEHHPGGKLLASVSPQRHTLRIQAPGYAPQSSSFSPRQTIRLEPEGRIRGRIVFEGWPVPEATIRIERAWLAEEPDTLLECYENEEWDGGYDLDDYTGRLRTVSSDAEGHFELGELARGTYEVGVTASVGAPRTLRTVQVVAGETLDLGDLELHSAAGVRGRVIVGAGVVASGLILHREHSLDDELDDVTIGPDGRFELTGLTAGEHRLTIEDMPGVVLAMRSREASRSGSRSSPRWASGSPGNRSRSGPGKNEPSSSASRPPRSKFCFLRTSRSPRWA